MTSKLPLPRKVCFPHSLIFSWLTSHTSAASVAAANLSKGKKKATVCMLYILFFLSTDKFVQVKRRRLSKECADTDDDDMPLPLDTKNATAGDASPPPVSLHF